MSIGARIRGIGRGRFGAVAIVGLLVGGMLGLGLSAPAFADTTLTFTLKLTNKAGAPLSGYEIFPIDVSDGAELPGDDPDNAAPGASGIYTMQLTAGDSYTLWFSPIGSSVSSGTIQYLGGTPFLSGATTFVPSATNNFLAASIATGGTITGKVTGPTGAALSNAEVDAYQYDGTSWTTSIFTHTNSSGVFTFANAVPGSYRFEFYAAGGVYQPIYSGGATTLASATSTFVQVGATSTVNQKFGTGTGAISGTAIVNFPAYGNLPDNDRVPVAIPVTAMSGASATAIDPDKSVAGGASNSAGAWTIKNLPAGNYVVELFPGFLGESTVYLSASGANDVALSGASIVAVVAGKTTATGTTTFAGDDTNDGSDPEYTVQDTDGNAIENAQVSVAPTTNPFDVASGVSDSDGVVALSDEFGDVSEDGSGGDSDNPLTPGWYTLTVIDPAAGHDPIHEDVYLDFGSNAITLTMPDLTGAPTFATGAAISQTGSGEPVGTQYTASAAPTRSDAVLSYQWLRTAVGGSPTQIYGATNPAYVSTGADLGDTISVRVTATSFGFDPAYSYATVSGATTVGPTLVNTARPDVVPATGIFVGTTLQAHVGSWTLGGSATDGIQYTYAWNRGGVAIAGQTASSYVVQPADMGANLTVAVKANKLGYGSATATQPYAIVPAAHPAPVVTKSPTITARVSKGVTTYTVSAGSWNTTGLAISYQWSDGGAPVSTGASVTSTQVAAALSPETPGADPLTVVVSASRSGYLTGASATIVALKGTAAITQNSAPEIFDTTTATDVSGTNALHYGDHLTVKTHGSWSANTSGGASSYSYKWYRNGVAISGATTSSYVIGTADLAGSPEITVVETAISTLYPNAVGAQTQVGQVQLLTIGAAASTSLVGPSEDGQLDAVSVGAWGTAAVVNGYQWLDCPTGSTCTDPTNTADFLAISKATASSLKLSASYGYVAVRVTGTKVGYANLSTVSAIAQVVPATVVTNTVLPTVAGTVSGIAHVGAKLTATAGSWSVATPAIGYQWQSSTDGTTWTPITGAVASTYTPTGLDYATGGVDIRVEVTATKGGVSNHADAAPHVIGLGTLKITTAPKVTITTTSDTVSAGATSPAVVPTAQWYVDASADTNADGTTRTRARSLPADTGSAIYVDLTYALQGYSPITTRLLAQVGATTVGNVEVTGTKFGTTLGIATTSDYMTDAAASSRSYTYQWYENGVAISKATGATYAPPSTYLGRSIQVRVWGKSALYATAYVTSAAVKLATGTFTTGSGTPTIAVTGAVQPGNVLTAVADSAADYGTSGITLKYQWQRSTNSGATWTSITGATAARYTPLATDVNDQLKVYVAASKTGYTGISLPSAAVTVVYSPTLVAFVPPSVVGTGKVGGVMTVSPGVWNTPTLNYSYAWYRNGQQIGGVTSASWTPTADSLGENIIVYVTASRIGWLPVTVATQQFTVALADAPVATTSPVISKLASPANTYSVSPGAWNVDGLTYTYQWYVGGNAADDPTGANGATSSTFTADGTQSGALSVVITVSRTGYTSVTKTISSSVVLAFG